MEREGTANWLILFIADTTGAETGDSGAVVIKPQVVLAYGWTIQNSYYATLDGFRISGAGLSQPNGVFLDNSESITIKDCEIDNTIRGIYNFSSSLTIDTCNVHDTTTCGIWLDDIDQGDLQITNLTLTDNGTYGLYLDACDFTFNATNLGALTSSGCETTIAAVGGTVGFDNVTVSGGTVACVQMASGILTAYFALLSHGDKIMGLSLSHGGHLTHGHPVNFSGMFFEVVSYG